MSAVIFEVEPAPSQQQNYLSIATQMRDRVQEVDGVISGERFHSLTNPKKLLSLPFFRNEAAVAAWRQREHHRRAQEAGRGGIFTDYHLRIAELTRDHGLFDRDQAPVGSRATRPG